MLTFFDADEFTLKDYEGVDRHRTVYVLVFQQGSYLRDRVMRICESFLGKIF